MKYLLFTLFLFLISCEVNEKISQKKISQLYVDILIAEETYKTDSDSMKIVIDSLYKFHEITESKYLKEFENYSYTEDTWKEFFKNAEEYLDTLKAVEKRANIKKSLSSS